LNPGSRTNPASAWDIARLRVKEIRVAFIDLVLLLEVHGVK
jgi:hypothetical protein